MLQACFFLLSIFNINQYSFYFYSLNIDLFCYEVLYDKKYGTDTNCLSDLPTAWTKLEGGQITQCSDTCTKQYDSSTIVKFISDENSSLGLKFSFNPTPTQPFSFIGVDIIYFQTGGTVIGLRINGSSSATTVYSTLQTTYDENYSISCPDLRSFYRGSAILSTNQLQSGNTVYINIEKDSPSQSIGIRSIRVWTNCRENCLTCSDATNCNICQPGFQLYQMPSGEFVCEQTKGCAAMNCYSCFIGDQSQICYKCAAGYNLNATGTKCNLANQTLCPAYTYIDQSGTCQQYTYSCQYQDRTTNQWTACVNQEDPRYYKCDNRMAVRVYNIENYGVFQCGCGIPNCSSCSADLTTCSQCKFGYYFNPGTSQCDSMCPSTQFYNGSFCQSCTVANCQSCSQAGTCDKCKASYVYNNLTQRCDQFIPQCSQGYYYNQTSNSCQQSCPDQNCLTCNPSGVCTTCINNYTWSTTDNRCNKNCLSNQYFDYVQNNCINCPTNCQTCDSSQCTQCNSGYLWNANDSRCNMSCSSNQYFDSVNNNCINCPANCQTCNSTQCTLCNSGYMWDSSVKTCVSCSSNQYYDSVNKNCVNCPLNCLTCNSSQCTQCNNGYLWSSNDLRCNMICSSNQYFDNANNICINCTTNCQTCNSTQCTQCNNGYTWSSGDQRCNMICQSNQYFNQSTNNCINCTQFCLLCNQNDCTLCQPGYLYDSTDKKCYIQCNTGYYLDKINNMCNACIDNCLNCSSMQNCTQCQISYTYNQIANACEKICQASQYLDVQKNQCTNCMQNCTSCTDSNSCNQCSQGYSYSSLNKICYQDCQSNQYYNETSNKCLDCGNNCLTCNQNQCTKCNQSFFTSQNDNQNCQPCSISNCKTCSSLNICAECESNYNLSLDKSKCSQGCSVDFCTQCSSQNSSACQQCQDGYELVQSQGICQPVLVVQKGQTDVNLGIKLGDDGYSIQIKFSNSVSYDNIDKSNLIYLNITNVQNYTYTIQDFEPKEIKLDIVSQENIKNQQIKIGFKNKNFVLKNQIKTIEIQQNLSPSFVVIPQSQKVATQQATQLGSGATTLLATMIPIITMSNFYVLVNTIDITGFLYYMLYINIRNPENVVQFYSIFQNFQYPFIPNLFQYVVSPNYQQTSFPKFMENQTDFYFLNSTGQAFTIHLLIMSLYLIAKIMSMIKIKYVQDYFIKAVNNTWEFNGMLDLIWNEYIYSLVGVLLQFNCYDFGDSSAFLNYTIHSLFSVIILGIPFLITFLIYKQPNVTENKRFQTKLGSIIGGLNIQQLEISSPKIKDIQDDKREPMDALSLDNIINQHKKEDIQGKSDYFQSQYQGSQDLLVLSVKPSFVQKIKSYNKYYNCILYFRKMLFGLILVFLTEYQYLQLVLLIMLNIFILFFVVLAQPLQSKYENIKNCFGEIILICIGISLSLLVQDNESEDEMFRLKIGWIIIAFTSFILLWHTIQLTYETLKSLLILMKNIVNLAFRRSQKVKPVIKETKKIDIEANNHEEKTQKNVKQETKFQELKQNQRKVSNQLEDTELILFQSNTNLPISDDLQKADSIQQIAKVSSNKNENLFIQSNNNSNDNLYINNLKSNDNVFLKPSDQKTTRTKRKSNFSNNSNKMYLNISHNQNTNRILNGFNTNREDNTFMNDNNNNNNNQQASQNHIIQHID